MLGITLLRIRASKIYDDELYFTVEPGTTADSWRGDLRTYDHRTPIAAALRQVATPASIGMADDHIRFVTVGPDHLTVVDALRRRFRQWYHFDQVELLYRAPGNWRSDLTVSLRAGTNGQVAKLTLLNASNADTLLELANKLKATGLCYRILPNGDDIEVTLTAEAAANNATLMVSYQTLAIAYFS